MSRVFYSKFYFGCGFMASVIANGKSVIFLMLCIYCKVTGQKPRVNDD